MFWSNGYVDWKYCVYITVLKAWDQVLKDWPAVLQVWSGCTKCTPSILKLHQNEKKTCIAPVTHSGLTEPVTHTLTTRRENWRKHQTDICEQSWDTRQGFQLPHHPDTETHMLCVQRLNWASGSFTKIHVYFSSSWDNWITVRDNRKHSHCDLNSALTYERL